MKRRDVKSHCPVNFALEHIGDPWTLLIVRDIAMWGKHTFSEFLSSDERVAKNILAARLDTMEKSGILTKTPDPADRRRWRYDLTEKGLSLIPPMLEMAIWSEQFDTETLAPKPFVDALKWNRNEMYKAAVEHVRAGRPIFPDMLRSL